MKKEIIYTHPNCASRLTMKRRSGDIVTMNCIDAPKQVNIKGKMVFQVIVTDIKYLTVNK